MPEYTKLRQELKDEEFRTWNKTTDDEVKCQDFFLPIQLPGDPGWNRRNGHNTVSYYQGTTEENYQQYHITMSYSQDIPGQLNLHETYPENKGATEKDSTFIVKNGKLEWDQKSPKPTDNIIEIVQKIESYRNSRYNSRILDNRKGKDQKKQTQEIKHKQLFDIDIKETVYGQSVAESLKSHLVQQVQGIEVTVMLIVKDKYRVSIKKKDVPSKVIKQQNEDAIKNAIQGWKETQTMLVQEDAVTSPQPEKKTVSTEKSAQETTTDAVGGRLSRFDDPKLFAVSANQKTVSIDTPSPPAQLAAISPRIQPVQGDNVGTGSTETDNSRGKKIQKQEGGGRGLGGRR